MGLPGGGGGIAIGVEVEVCVCNEEFCSRGSSGVDVDSEGCSGGGSGESSGEG